MFNNRKIGIFRSKKLNLLKKNPEKFWKGVVAIKDYAFENNVKLTEIEIPDTVEKIGSGAFWKCKNLTDVKLPKNLKEISRGLFSKCSSLTEIEIPDSVTIIKDLAFTGCSSLTEIEIPDSVEVIENNAFNGCQNLQKIILPKDLKEIGEYSFSDCASLTEIEIPDGVEVIPDMTFNQCNNLSKIKLPNNLKGIEKGAFFKCSSLTEIEIPESVEEFGLAAFKGCENLEKVNLPKNLKEIPHNFLGYCSSLSEIEIPDSVTKIDSYAFNCCTNLKKVKLPKNLKEILQGLFYNCSSLTEIEIPDGVTNIEDLAFANCSSLTEIEIPDSVKNLGVAAFKDCKNLKKVKLPSGVTCICNSTFENCSSLTEIEIPDTMEEIEDTAFCSCQNLSKVKLPNRIRRLGSAIFHGCSSLTEVYLPDDLTYFEKDTFANIPNTVTFYYKGETLSNKIFPIYNQLKNLCNASDEDRQLYVKIYTSNIKVSWLRVIPAKELMDFNPRLWKKLTDRVSQNSKDVKVINYEDLFRLARNIGLFDEERMITIKNGQGKDTQVHLNELAFNFLQKFTKDVPIDRMHIHLSSMYAKGINEEFIKFISNKVNYDDIISNIDKNDSILTNIYNWFVERASLENLTDIERDDNLTNIPTSENNRYRVRTYEAGENGVDKTRWKAATAELIIKDLAKKKFTGIKTTREREIAENLIQVTDYQQEHFDKAVEIDKEREERKVPDFIVGKHIGQNRTQAYMEYAGKTKGIKDKILKEAGGTINNQVDISNKVFTYDTLAKSDIANFSIGFMTSCCARLYGAGGGAMRASIIHKNMQPLVVRNDKDEIVAYSIMYINREEGYAILNDIEVNKRYEGQEEQLKTIYEKMRRCAIENIEEYNKTANIPITKLNCGISPNWSAINEYIKKNPQSSILKAPNFDNFKYSGSGSWSGDWHNGQWTIWEDDEIEK